MSMLTIDDFKSVMRAVAGDDDSIDLSGDVNDTLLVDLGYDSLAILEMGSILQQRYGIDVPDDSAERMTTPREAVAYINGL